MCSVIVVLCLSPGLIEAVPSHEGSGGFLVPAKTV